MQTKYSLWIVGSPRLTTKLESIFKPGWDISGPDVEMQERRSTNHQCHCKSHMGKKLQGSRLRAKKRAREALDELQSSQAEVAVVSDTAFVLDRDGDCATISKPASNRLAKDAKKSTRKNSQLSEHDQKKVDRLLKTHNKDELVKLAEEGRKKLESKRNPFRATRKSKTGKFDLWEENESKAEGSDAPKTSIRPHRKIAGIAPEHTKVVAKPNKPPAEFKSVPAVEAISGQSYVPDLEAQSKVIQVAAAIEIKRENAIKKETEPISQGFSEETKALLITGDSDDESSSDDESLPDIAIGAIPRRAQKLTRAQRNKQKRLRLQEAELAKARHEKKLIKQIGEIPVFNKELKKLETEKSQKPQQDKKRKRREEDPLDTPSIPVLLQSSGSLRSMKVMGSLTEERRNTLVERGLAEKPSFAHDAKRRRKVSRHKARKKVRDIRK